MRAVIRILRDIRAEGLWSLAGDTFSMVDFGHQFRLAWVTGPGFMHPVFELRAI